MDCTDWMRKYLGLREETEGDDKQEIERKEIDGESYSINTQKILFQTMLFLITSLNLKKTDNVKKQYLHVFEVYRVQREL